MSVRVYAIGWIAWVLFAVVWELCAVKQGRGALTSFFFLVSRNDIARATITAFMVWWMYHWHVEPRMFPNLKGPGPDDAGVTLLAWLLSFFGQRGVKPPK